MLYAILASSEVVDDVVAPVRGSQGLSCYEDYVHQVANEEESQGGEFQESHGRVAKVESVHTEHAQEDREEESGVKVVSIGELARNLLVEGCVAGVVTDYPRYCITTLTGQARTIDGVAASELLSVWVDVSLQTEILAGQKVGAVHTCLLTVVLLSLDTGADEQQHQA